MPVFGIYTEGPAVKPPGLHSDSGLTGASLEAVPHTQTVSSAWQPRARVEGSSNHLGEWACSLRGFSKAAPAVPLFNPFSGHSFQFPLFFVCLFIHYSCSFIHSFILRTAQSLRGQSQSQTKLAWNPLLPAVGLWANNLTCPFPCLKKWGWCSSQGCLEG